MKRSLIIVFLSLVPACLFAQGPSPADSLVEACGLRLTRGGKILSNAETKELFLAAYPNGEERFEDFTHLERKRTVGRCLALAGIGVTAGSTWLQIKAFQNAAEGNGCVSPGGFPLIIGGLGMIGTGIGMCLSSYLNAKSIAIELNERKAIKVTPATSANGFGVIFNF